MTGTGLGHRSSPTRGSVYDFEMRRGHSPTHLHSGSKSSVKFQGTPYLGRSHQRQDGSGDPHTTTGLLQSQFEHESEVPLNSRKEESCTVMSEDRSHSLLSRFYTSSPTPVGRLAFDKSANCAKVSFVPQEESLLCAFTPKLDGERERMDRLLMSSNERPAEVDSFQVVPFGLQERDLSDVVTVV